MRTGTAGPVLMLMGPTACGKTEAAMGLAERFPVEIVSVDSSLVYRGMDIGTAKPAPEQLARFPHHLVDIREPGDTYSAAQFCADAERLLVEIRARGRVPLLVGGTMFYFRALEKGLSALPPSDPRLRRRLEETARERGWPALHAELARLDPQRAAQIAPRDKQRVQRALEIAMLTGGTLRTLPRRPSGGAQRFVKIGLAHSDRAVLHRRIEARFRAMLELGLVAEVEDLLFRRGISPELPAMRMVGYRQVARFLQDEVGYNEMVQQGIAATRQLAKRQLTWLRNQGGITWLDAAPTASGSVLQAYIHGKLTLLGVQLH